MSHSQGERGKIHRAFTLIGGFMSAAERVDSPPLTAPDEPPDNIPPQGASCSTLIVARNKPDRDCPVLTFLL